MESGRVAGILAQSKKCASATALARARAMQGSGGCAGGACAPRDSTIEKAVPQSSTRVKQQASDCYLHQGPEYGVPESIRLARLQQKTLDLERDPTNRFARFSAFRGPFVPICPPIPQWYYTAGEPVLQGPCGIGRESAEVAISASKNPNSGSST
jgi:hypothetical protein